MKTFTYVYAGNAFRLCDDCCGQAVGVTATYVVGDNAHDNHAIIDAADRSDIWVHLKDIPSCHVILHLVVDEEILKDAGSKRKKVYRDILRKATRQGGVICRQHSKTSVRNAGLGKSKVGVVAYSVGNIEKSVVPGQVFTHGESMSFAV